MNQVAGVAKALEGKAQAMAKLFNALPDLPRNQLKKAPVRKK
jgi:hypothetical protein